MYKWMKYDPLKQDRLITFKLFVTVMLVVNHLELKNIPRARSTKTAPSAPAGLGLSLDLEAQGRKKALSYDLDRCYGVTKLKRSHLSNGWS